MGKNWVEFIGFVAGYLFSGRGYTARLAGMLPFAAIRRQDTSTCEGEQAFTGTGGWFVFAKFFAVGAFATKNSRIHSFYAVMLKLESACGAARLCRFQQALSREKGATMPYMPFVYFGVRPE